jgi:hypothetical protein
MGVNVNNGIAAHSIPPWAGQLKVVMKYELPVKCFPMHRNDVGHAQTAPYGSVTLARTTSVVFPWLDDVEQALEYREGILWSLGGSRDHDAAEFAAS